MKFRSLWSFVLSLLVLACGKPGVSDVKTAASVVDGTELKRLADQSAENDFALARFGDEPTSETSEVVVLSGRVENEPFRLWFVVPLPIKVGEEIEVDSDEAAQLVIGEPYTFVSHDLEVKVRIEKDRKTAWFSAEADNDEVSRERSSYSFRGRFDASALFAKSLPGKTLAPELLPRADYVPTYLRYRDSEIPPAQGFTLESRTSIPLVLLGVGLFAVTYGRPLAVAAHESEVVGEKYAIPLIGPTLVFFMWCDATSYRSPHIYEWMVIVPATLGVSVLQIGGALLASGLIGRSRYWERVRAREATALNFDLPAPIVTPNFQGLALSGSF